MDVQGILWRLFAVCLRSFFSLFHVTLVFVCLTLGIYFPVFSIKETPQGVNICNVPYYVVRLYYKRAQNDIAFRNSDMQLQYRANDHIWLSLQGYLAQA